MKKYLYHLILAAVLIFIQYDISIAGEILDNFIRLAFENREEIQIAEEQVKLSQIRILNALRIMGPTISFEYFTSKGKTLKDPYQRKSYGLGVGQSIFEGGKKYYNLKKEEKAVEIAKNNYYRLNNTIKLEVIQAYYEYILHQERLKNINDLLSEIENEFIIAKKKYTAGIITQISYLEVLNKKEEISLEREILENNLQISKLMLKEKCGIDSLRNTFLERGRLFKETTVLKFSLSTLKEEALINRSDMSIARALVSQTKYSEKTVKADAWPSISLEGFMGKSGEAFVDDDLVLASEWSISANANWMFWGNMLGYKYGRRKTEPSQILDVSVRTESDEHTIKFGLLNRLDYYSVKKERKIVFMQAVRDLNKARENINIEVKRSYDNYMNSLKMIELTEKRFKLSQKKVKIIEKQKLLGEASSKDIVDTKIEYTRNMNSMLDAVYKNRIAIAELNKSCGMEVFQ